MATTSEEIKGVDFSKESLLNPNISSHKVRRSGRERKEKRSFSPNPNSDSNLAKKSKRKQGSPQKLQQNTAKPFDKLSDGRPFSCDICKSPYICKPTNRGGLRHGAIASKKPKYLPSPRQKIDPNTGELLLLCNACGLAFDRPKKAPKLENIVESERENCLEEARTFAQMLVTEFNDSDADRLYCPNYSTRYCGCLQNYILADGLKSVRTNHKCQELLHLIKKARELSNSKSQLEKRKKLDQEKTDVATGQTKTHEEFVLKWRQKLRDEYHLCEKSTQKILQYSNNFIYKRLKNRDEMPRTEMQKGKKMKGYFKPIADLWSQPCCVDNCAIMALTHSALLKQWRDRALSGQQEARRVLAEMLTPSGGTRSNCVKFIQWVTGCSAGTIAKVRQQMKRTGGEREPPEHGLKSYRSQRKKKENIEEESSMSSNTSSSVNLQSTVTDIPIMADWNNLVTDPLSTDSSQKVLGSDSLLIHQIEGQLLPQLMETTSTVTSSPPQVAEEGTSYEQQAIQLSVPTGPLLLYNHGGQTFVIDSSGVFTSLNTYPVDQELQANESECSVISISQEALQSSLQIQNIQQSDSEPKADSCEVMNIKHSTAANKSDCQKLESLLSRTSESSILSNYPDPSNMTNMGAVSNFFPDDGNSENSTVLVNNTCNPGQWSQIVDVSQMVNISKYGQNTVFLQVGQHANVVDTSVGLPQSDVTVSKDVNVTIVSAAEESLTGSSAISSDHLYNSANSTINNVINTNTSEISSHDIIGKQPEAVVNTVESNHLNTMITTEGTDYVSSINEFQDTNEILKVLNPIVKK